MPTQQQADHQIMVDTVKQFLSGRLELGLNLIPIGAALNRLKKEEGFNSALLQGLVEWLDENPANIQGLAMLASESLRQRVVNIINSKIVKPAEATVVEEEKSEGEEVDA